LNLEVKGLLAMASPFPTADSVLRLLEPDGSSPNLLWDRVFTGTYDKPFIVDSGRIRSLHFDLDCVQSSMDLDDPYELSLAYTRNMMAFLLFNSAPDRILLLGLGGGSLAKFCYRQLPSSAITVIEVNPDVLALRNAFRIPADDARFRVVREDACTYLGNLPYRKDVLLADACDREGITSGLNALEFYQNAWNGLSEHGVFVTNLCANQEDCASHLTKIRRVFGEGYMQLSVRPDGNLIVLAFKERLENIEWDRLTSTADNLRREYRIPFPHYVRRMALDWKSRHRWTEPAVLSGRVSQSLIVR
jgi:spermidine synthase